MLKFKDYVFIDLLLKFDSVLHNFSTRIYSNLLDFEQIWLALLDYCSADHRDCTTCSWLSLRIATSPNR
jgi:hypothetical protein